MALTFANSNAFTVALNGKRDKLIHLLPLLNDLPQSLTVPDGVREMLVDKVTSRCDALFKKERRHVDVQRRAVCLVVYPYSNIFLTMLNCTIPHLPRCLPQIETAYLISNFVHEA
jgi:hypothetical protein